MAKMMTVLLMIAASLLSAADEKSGQEVTGVGAFPVSDSVTGLWLLGEPQGGRAQPIVMVYYRGLAGWHDRKWVSKSDFGKTTWLAKLSSDDLELVIEYGSGGTDVKVQGHSVDLEVANVFLVSPIGDPTKRPVVEAVGFMVFTIPGDANPALHVLATNRAIAEKVVR